MTDHREGTHVGTQGESPHEAVGLRNQLRERWHAQSERTRMGESLGGAIVLAIFFYFLDHALAVAVLTIAAIYWTYRLPPLPWRLVAQAVLVGVFLIFGPRSFAILLAIAYALSWIPARRRAWAIPAAVLLMAIAYPFYVDKLFTVPVFGAWPDVPTGVYMLVFVMMAVGLNIVVGYAGLLDLGYVAFYATGAYTAAWFASAQFAGQRCPKPGVSVDNCPVAAVPVHNFNFWGVGVPAGTGGIHISVWLLLLAAGIITAAFGIIIGLPTLRLRGDYLAIVTLGFGEILPQIARNGDSLFGYNVTNGPNGITPLDPPGFGHAVSNATGGVLPSNFLTCCTAKYFGHTIESADVYFWFAIILLLITVFCSFRLQFSRLGRAWIAIREDETAAAAMGIPLMRTKTWAYASGAFFGGVAGAYYAVFKSATFPGDFFFNISVFILCMVILGGMGNIWGVVVGAAFLAYLNQEGLANTGAWINANIHVGKHHPNIDVPLYSAGIYGVIIVVTMLFRPEGLIPSRRRAAELHEGVHDEPLYDTAHAGAEA
ncbi:MAG TPA: branched-chain amino acid ABC transporter permease [Gaiellaceae bacterium]|nr:branched-chain amino acid ABC transporter permease [Gaiellaceae bacterium]